MSQRHKLRGVIFDLDGTLVDSKLDFVRMRADIGVPEGEGILEFIEKMPHAHSREEARRILHKHELAGAHAATLISGVTELLEELDQLGLHKAVFTRNDKEPTRIVVDRFFPKTFSSVITREDAPAKPDPTGLLRICESWNCLSHEVIYVGDYLYDILAGRRASMKTVLYLSDEPWAHYADDADHVTRDLLQFARRFAQVMTQELAFTL